MYELISLILVIVAYFLYTPHCHKSYKTVIEGEDFELNYKLSTDRFPITFLKNGGFLAETNNVTRRIDGRWKTLVINGITLNDAGFYDLVCNHRRHGLVKLSVQRMCYMYL